MHESDAIRKVHDYLPPYLIAWKLAVMFKSGIPDAYYAGPQSALWIEYKKVTSLPKRENTVIVPDLSKNQEATLQGLYANGIPTWVVLYAEKERTYLIFHYPWEWKGAVRSELKEVKGHRALANAIHEFIAGSPLSYEASPKRSVGSSVFIPE